RPSRVSIPSHYAMFLFTSPTTPPIYTLSLHDALPIFPPALAPLSRPDVPRPYGSSACLYSMRPEDRVEMPAAHNSRGKDSGAALWTWPSTSGYGVEDEDCACGTKGVAAHDVDRDRTSASRRRLAHRQIGRAACRA